MFPSFINFYRLDLLAEAVTVARLSPSLSISLSACELCSYFETRGDSAIEEESADTDAMSDERVGGKSYLSASVLAFCPIGISLSISTDCVSSTDKISKNATSSFARTFEISD